MSSGGPNSSAVPLPTEAGAPVVSPALRTRLQKLFEHAGRLMQQEKYDHDYANTMLADCVANDPGNQTYLERFFENLGRKHGKKKSRGIFGGGGGGLSSRMKKAQQKQDHTESLRAGLETLFGDPWDVPTLRALAQVCEALKLTESELKFLKGALEAKPKDVEVNRHCAKSLARMGQYDQAIACWHRVEEANRYDPEPSKMISMLTLEKARPKVMGDDLSPVEKAKFAAMQAAQHAKTQAFQQGSAPAAATPKREVQLTPRQHLEKSIAEDPTALEHYTQLAELHAHEGRLGEAEAVLTRALAASGNNISMRERLEDMQIRRAQQQLAVAEKRAAVDATPEAQELPKRFKAELNRLELEIFQARAERYPQEAKWKFELATRLKRAGNFSEAAKYYQEAGGSRTFHVSAVLELGECLHQMKQYQKALECYLRAAETADSEQAERKKLALYRAGVLASGLKNVEQAEKCLGQLIGLDAHFKDAAERLDKVRQMRHKG